MNSKTRRKRVFCIVIVILILFGSVITIFALNNWFLGDVNSDGLTSATDISIIRQYVCKMISVSSEQENAGDVNGDGKLNILDANYIRLLINDKIDGFPTCIVKFVDYDDRLISIQKVLSGESATAPDEPQRPGYIFDGWLGNYLNVNSSITIVAKYRVAPSSHTVTFVNYDNSVISEQVVPRGGKAVLPATPQREGYFFTGWSGAFDNVLSDNIVTATFTPNTSPNIFAIDSHVVSPGDSFTLKLQMQGAVAIAGFDMNLMYDSEVIELVSIDKEFSYDVIANTAQLGTVTFNWGSASNKTSSGKTIFEITFKVKSDTEATDTIITMNKTEAVRIPNGGGAAVGADITLTEAVVNIN